MADLMQAINIMAVLPPLILLANDKPSKPPACFGFIDKDFLVNFGELVGAANSFHGHAFLA